MNEIDFCKKWCHLNDIQAVIVSQHSAKGTFVGVGRAIGQPEWYPAVLLGEQVNIIDGAGHYALCSVIGRIAYMPDKEDHQKMEIKAIEIPVRDLVNGFVDNAEEGVRGYKGLLDIRPPYQREFIYNAKQQAAVIDTVMKGFPLNVMYWSERDDGTYEIIDGQQRTLSICKYVDNDFAYEERFFQNLKSDEKERLLNYKLTIYLCKGTDSEKLAWFKTINIAGEQLTDQELRNAVYAGSWVMDAKRHFSKTGCPAYMIGNRYLSGTPIRQDYLETVIKWISNNNIEEYMAEHQHYPNANDLWLYFQSVIAWVQALFPTYRKEMKHVEWGELYNIYKDISYDVTKLEEEVSNLMADDEVTSKKGVYYYVLTRKEKYLNLRTFTPSQKREAYEKQGGICAICGEQFALEDMEADHIIPWSQGGKTTIENCQLLCKEDHNRKAKR